MGQRFKSAPCIGFCSTTYGDMVCRGCYRSLHEVLKWVHLSAAEKQAFYDKIAQLAEEEVVKLLEITDPELVQQWVNTLSVYCEDASKRSMAYDILQALQQGLNIVQSMPQACRLKGGISIRDAYRQIDQAIYQRLNAEC